MRAGIVDAVIEEIYESGLEKLTLRGVARRLGCSTTVILSYYINKDDLLAQVHTITGRRGLERLQEAAAKHPDSLFDLLKVLLPTDEERKKEWAVWISFWSAAIGNPTFATTLKTDTRRAYKLVQTFLNKMGADDQRPDAVDNLSKGRSLILHVFAIALHAMFDQRGWSPTQQRAELRLQCERVIST